MNSLHHALFAPSSVAIVGASDNPTKTTSRPLRYLRRSGWAGRVYPVNPFHDLVMGEKSWHSLRDLPEVPEHVYVLTDSDLAIESVRECVRLEVPVVSLVANGFNETDDAGRARVDELRRILRDSSTRLLGPGTLGIATPPTGYCLTANGAFAELEDSEGGVFVASQSGSMIGALLSRGRGSGVGFAGLVATGNEIDLSLGEVCELTLDDPEVTSYALFLENLRGSDAMRSFACRAVERGKPVVVYKLGRSAAAAELSVGHTGALAGDDEVAEAFFSEYGMIRVNHLDALLEGQALASRIGPRSEDSPLRVVAFTTTGGGGAMVIDQLDTQGATLVGPSDKTRDALAEIGVNATTSPLIDLELSGARYEVVKGTIEILAASREFDVVVAVAGSSARFHPELVVTPIADSADAPTAVAAFVVPEAPEAHRQLQAAGISSFRTPEACADAIVALSRRRAPVQRGTNIPAVSSRRVLNEDESHQVLADLGVPVAPRALRALDEPIGDPGFEGPYVMKAVSRDLPHKSDAGGVILGIETAADLEAARNRIIDAVRAYDPAVVLEGVLIQPELSGLGEVIVGYRVDPDVGPVVLVAPGGTAAELVPGGSLALAPVTVERARSMISSVKALSLLDGYRGAPRGDIDALARVVSAVSQGAGSSDEPVVELEANPVLVRPDGQGVVAVDALAVRGVRA